MTKKKRLTVADIRSRLDAIRRTAAGGDDEVAHCEQDSLFVEVLTAIAEHRCENPTTCAAVALEVNDIEFSRWYA